MISLTNSGFSLFSGFVVFAVVGNLAHATGEAVETVAASGASLAFIVFPEALKGVHPIFGTLFFFILLLLGLDSAFAWARALEGPTDGSFVPLLAALSSLYPFGCGSLWCLSNRTRHNFPRVGF